MPWTLGDKLVLGFTTSDSTGSAVAASSLPTASARRNGAADALPVTVASSGGGEYVVSATPSVASGYVADDNFAVFVTASIAGTSAKAIVFQDILKANDSDDLATDIGALKDLSAASAQAGLSTSAAVTTRFDTVDGTLSNLNDLSFASAEDAASNALATYGAAVPGDEMNLATSAIGSAQIDSNGIAVIQAGLATTVGLAVVRAMAAGNMAVTAETPAGFDTLVYFTPGATQVDANRVMTLVINRTTGDTTTTVH